MKEISLSIFLNGSIAGARGCLHFWRSTVRNRGSTNRPLIIIIIMIDGYNQ